MLDKKDLNSIGQLLDDKLDPVKQQLFSIESDIKDIKTQLKLIRKSGNEDIYAVTKDVEKLKKEVFKLKERIKILSSRKS